MMMHFHDTTRKIALICALGCVFINAAQAQDFSDDDTDEGGNWDFFIGAGVQYEPEYEGSDKYDTEFLPGVQIVWRDRLLFTQDGLGAFIVNQEKLRIAAAVGYGGGRKESDSAYLRGLGDIDDGAVFLLGAQYDLGPAVATADVRKFASGSEGTLVTFGLQSQVPFGVVRGTLAPTGTSVRDATNDRGLVLIGGISADWANDSYNQAFFGVNPAQSAASGLSQYSAGSGFKSISAELGFTKPLGRNWGITGLVEYSRLLGDAVDSPVVRSKDAVSTTLAVGFSF